MREDMHKVIVERPRLRYGKKSGYSRDGRIFRNRVHEDEDGGFAPARLGMKAGYGSRRWLNEHLGPLERWLRAQLRRHWDDIYSELCAGIDRRNTVQAHIFTHIEDFVVLDTRLIDGHLFGKTYWGRDLVPIGEMRQEMFTDPRTRVLLPNHARIANIRKAKALRRMKSLEAQTCRRILGESEQLHFIDGLWYAVGLAPIPSYDKCRDVVLREYVSRENARRAGSRSACVLYDKPGWYAVWKRQLGKKELKRHGLNEKAGNPRPFLITYVAPQGA